MIYELLETNELGQKVYARIDDDGLCRITCLETDPDFLAWLEIADGKAYLEAQAE